MHSYTRRIQSLLAPHADPIAAPAMKRYMRDQFEYLGIKSPKLAEVLKGFYAQNGLPPVDALDLIVRDLWALPEREYQYTAVGLISRMEKQIPEGFIETLEHFVDHKILVGHGGHTGRRRSGLAFQTLSEDEAKIPGQMAQVR